MKTPKLTADALGKRIKQWQCKKSRIKFFNVSVEAGGVDSEKQSRTTKIY